MQVSMWLANIGIIRGMMKIPTTLLVFNVLIHRHIIPFSEKKH